MIATETMLPEMKACQQVCIECQTVCMETLNYCKTKTNIDMTVMCMIRDCAEMSMMCVNTIADGSEFAGRTCELCAEMCTRTALACELMTDGTMIAVAAICRKCAEHCDKIAKQSASYFRRPTSLTVADITR
jgi:hypothetical protein